MACLYDLIDRSNGGSFSLQVVRLNSPPLRGSVRYVNDFEWYRLLRYYLDLVVQTSSCDVVDKTTLVRCDAFDTTILVVCEWWWWGWWWCLLASSSHRVASLFVAWSRCISSCRLVITTTSLVYSCSCRCRAGGFILFHHGCWREDSWQGSKMLSMVMIATMLDHFYYSWRH
jgi:hypothetical protein